MERMPRARWERADPASAASRNSKGDIALLSDREADHPKGDLFVITDNLTSHLSAETNAWLAEHPRIQQVFIPKGARHGSICKRAGGGSFAVMRLPGQSFANPAEIDQARSVATAQLNARAKPWVWGRPPKSPRHRRRLFYYRI
jgi:hypothetical protein